MPTIPFGSCSEKKLLQRGEMVLSEVNLSVAPGEFVYLIGRVGSGKSSLLKTLYAEMQLLTGKGYVAGFDLRRLRTASDIPYLRRRIGIVFQDYQLLTDRNVFMNLYYVMKATGWKREQRDPRAHRPGARGWWNWARRATRCLSSFRAASSSGW